jgi:hypothetical protein
MLKAAPLEKMDFMRCGVNCKNEVYKKKYGLTEIKN